MLEIFWPEPSGFYAPFLTAKGPSVERRPRSPTCTCWGARPDRWPRKARRWAVGPLVLTTSLFFVSDFAKAMPFGCWGSRVSWPRFYDIPETWPNACTSYSSAKKKNESLGPQCEICSWHLYLIPFLFASRNGLTYWGLVSMKVWPLLCRSAEERVPNPDMHKHCLWLVFGNTVPRTRWGPFFWVEPIAHQHCPFFGFRLDCFLDTARNNLCFTTHHGLEMLSLQQYVLHFKIIPQNKIRWLSDFGTPLKNIIIKNNP